MRKIWIAALVSLALLGTGAFAQAPEEMVLPASLEIIREEAFCRNMSLGRVVLPEGVTSIGARAFAESSLQEIVIPASVTHIAPDTFEGCDAYTIIAPAGSYAACWDATRRADPAEHFRYSLQDGAAVITGYVGGQMKVTVPSLIDDYPVTEIAAGAFAGSSVRSCEIVEGIAKIAQGAFENCSMLCSVSIPASMESIAAGAFRGCGNLAGLDVAQGNQHYLAMDGALFAADGKTLLLYPAGASAIAYTVPAGVEEIGEQAFSGCDGLVRLVLPQGVQRIGENAIAHCASLAQISVPDSVQSVEAGNFTSCAKGMLVYCAEGSVVDGYSALTAAQKAYGAMPDSMAADAKDFVYYRNNGGIVISNYKGNSPVLVIPEEIDGYPVRTLTYIPGNFRKIMIPAGVTTIEAGAFSGRVQEFVLAEGISGYTMKEGMILTSDMKQLLYCAEDPFMARVEIPAGVEYIANGAFSDSAAEEIIVPDGVKEIKSGAFERAERLKQIKLPSSLKEMGYNVFMGCTALQQVEFGKGITVLPEDTFYGCSELMQVTLPSTLKTIEANAFAMCKKLQQMDIPAGVTSISDRAFIGCSGLQKINVASANTAYKTSGGVLFTKDMKKLLLFPAARTGSYTVPTNVTCIAKRAFSNASVEQVTMPSTVKVIETYAFEACYSLKKVSLSSKLTELQSGAFLGCSALETLKIPSTVTTIGSGAFSNCASLVEVTIPGTVKVISSSAFAYCENLARVTIGKGTQQIESYAFMECPNLEKIFIPATVTSVVGNAFEESLARLCVYAPAGSYAYTYAQDRGWPVVAGSGF